jgi:tetratricopeptide (TPR) repeat protein
MKYILCAVLVISAVLLPLALLADETHINVNVDPTGISDEIIKLDEHAVKMREQARERLEAKLAELSSEAYQVGALYYQAGEIETAVAYLQKAVFLDEANLEAHDLLIKASKKRDADETEIGAHYHQAMEYYRQGMLEKAVDELIIEIQENPDNEAARIKLNEIEALQ